MITTIQIRPVVGSPLTINDAIYPVHGWEPEIDLPENVLRKMQITGVWPTFSYPGAMKIPVEGHILGDGTTDTLRAISAMQRRRALLDACLPTINAQVLTARPHGVLRVRYDDMGEDADVDFHCIMARAPIQAGQGANIPFFLNFLCFNPYFTGVGSLAAYLP